MKCKRCGAGFTPVGRQVYCTPTCQIRYTREAANDRVLRSTVVNCTQCGQPFQQNRSDQMFCTPLCRRKAAELRHPLRRRGRLRPGLGVPQRVEHTDQAAPHDVGGVLVQDGFLGLQHGRDGIP